MTILRKVQRHNYTVIENELLVDDRLSYRARGIAAYLISKPDDWSVNIRHLMGAGSEGRQAIVTALHELATLGYMKRERRHENGQIGTYTYVADWPAFENDGTPEERIRGYAIEPTSDRQEPDPPETGASETGDSDSRPSQNRAAIVNTEIPITDVVSTDECVLETRITPTRPTVRIDSPYLKPNPMVDGMVPYGSGTNPVQVWYEFFEIAHNRSRLTGPQEDDLVRNVDNLKRWRVAVEHYSRQPYSPQRGSEKMKNLACVMDWYKNGVPKFGDDVGRERTQAEVSIERTLAYTEGAPVKYNTHVNGNGWNTPDATH